MTRWRGTRWVLAAGVVVMGCAGSDVGVGSGPSSMETVAATSDVGGPEPAEDAAASQGPVDGYTAVVSFDAMVGGYWVPTGALGRSFEQRPEAYWEFGARDGEPHVSGDDGCNPFGLDRGSADPPTAFVDGRLVNVVVSHGLSFCVVPGNGIVPGEGAEFWVDDSGTHLIASLDGSDEYVFFERRDAPPSPVTVEESTTDEADDAQAAMDQDAEADRRLAEAGREQLRAGLPIARQRWEAAGLTSYELRFSAACLECASFPPGPDQAEVVTVVDGEADSPWNDALPGATVEDWFEFLDGQLDAAWVVAADFHPVLGHPTGMRFVNREWTVQAEAPYEDWLVRDAAVTPPEGSPAIPAVAGPAEIELRLDGIGPHGFGEPLHLVEATLTRALGPPEVVGEIQHPPVFTCLRWGCSESTLLHWPDAGLLVAFSDRSAGGGVWPDPRLAAWTVTTTVPWWPGEVVAPDPTSTRVPAPPVRLTMVNGVGLGSSVAELHDAFPATVDGGWSDSSFVPTGFHVPDRDGVPVLDGDIDWPLVAELQSALNAAGASLTVDGIGGPSTTAELTAYRERTGLDDPASAFAALGIAAPPADAPVVRLSAGDWLWELECGYLEPFGVPSGC